MPANKKYLSTPGQRVVKITAAFAGGYLVTFTFHLFLMYFLDKKNVLVTGFFLYEKRYLITFPVTRSQKKAENDCSIPRRVKTISCSLRSGFLSFYQN